MVTKGFTHGGIFHADDVFSTALLKMLWPDIEIIRGMSVPEGFDGIVYDIGLGEYDHHQENKSYRENGVPYAAFGLLWKAFGKQILSNDEDVEQFDELFIQPLDCADNTGQYSEVSLLIADFNEIDSSNKTDDRFWEAVDFAHTILENRFRQITEKRKAKEYVEKLVNSQQGYVLEMPKFIPWKETVCQTEILYVIFPSLRGGYNVQAVPQNENTIQLKKAFPENWRGKEQETLYELTGIETFEFCHTSGFLCFARTLEDARKIAYLACEI